VIGSSEDNGRIFMASPTDPIIVTDIDEVLSDLPEVQVPFKSNANTKATEGSIEALKSLAPKARIIYLTARDNSLFSKTRAWLRLNGFPSGPVFVWNWNLKNYLGLSREEQRAYKAKFLEDLKKRFPHIVAAIGNRSHDAQAFIDAGVPAYILTKDSAAFSAPVVTAPDWQDLSTKINAKLPLQN
jgi:phosphatidate phosphatase PAH1